MLHINTNTFEKEDEINILFNDDITSFENIDMQYKNIYCTYCKNLESLKGAPDTCEIFKIINCQNLKSVQYTPKAGSINFLHCDSLKDLKGAPTNCGNFIVTSLDNLETLKGAPEVVDYKFSCVGCKNLKDLKGAPKKCETFDCSSCENLESLKGAPREVENFYCYDCKNLESLKGAPEKCDVFDCTDCHKLKTLDPLLKCDIGEVVADNDNGLLDDYLNKKDAIEKHGYDKAMEIFNMMVDLV